MFGGGLSLDVQSRIAQERVPTIAFRRIARERVPWALTRSRGFEGYVNRKSFKINPSA